MSSFPHIMLAFGALNEAAQALMFTQGIEAVLTTGQYLVDISLVPNVVNHFVTRAVITIMQSQSELHDS
ncbi:hypothetical protein D3C78_1210830 [compost metagenome]